jgi:hypothetical protein
MNPPKAGGFDAHGWIKNELQRMVGDIMRRNRHLADLGSGHMDYPLKSTRANLADSLAELRVYEERLDVFTTTAETLLWYSSQRAHGSLSLEESKNYVRELRLKARADWLSFHKVTEEGAEEGAEEGTEDEGDAPEAEDFNGESLVGREDSNYIDKP